MTGRAGIVTGKRCLQVQLGRRNVECCDHDLTFNGVGVTKCVRETECMKETECVTETEGITETKCITEAENHHVVSSIIYQ